MAGRQLFRNCSIFTNQGSYIAFWGLLTLPQYHTMCYPIFKCGTRKSGVFSQGDADSRRRDVRQVPSLRQRRRFPPTLPTRNNMRLPKYNASMKA